MTTPPLDAYLVGCSDADLFTPAEHAIGSIRHPGTGETSPILSLRTVSSALTDAGLRVTVSNVRDYLRGFGEHGRFLVAAARMGAVCYATGCVQ